MSATVQGNFVSPATPAIPNYTVRLVPLSLIDHASGGSHVRLDWQHDNGYKALKELRDSIRDNGVLHPVLVRPDGDHYALIAGYRRCAAARLAGLETIPALICPLPDEQAWAVTIIENIHRQDLSPADEGHAFCDLYIHGMSVSVIAQMIHRNSRYVRDVLDIYGNVVIGEARDQGRITTKAARLLRRLQRWFVEGRHQHVDETGRRSILVFHEALALCRRLREGGRVSYEEVVDLLDHYKRWNVPHTQKAYTEMLVQNGLLQLPYLRYVDPAYYEALCDEMEQIYRDACESYIEGIYRDACASYWEDREADKGCCDGEETDPAYGLLLEPLPFVRPTVNTIAYNAPTLNPDPLQCRNILYDLINNGLLALERGSSGYAFVQYPHPLTPVSAGVVEDTPQGWSCSDPADIAEDVPRLTPCYDRDQADATLPHVEPDDVVFQRLLQPLRRDKSAHIVIEAIANYGLNHGASWSTLADACHALWASEQ